jgi:hypothetical protein
MSKQNRTRASAPDAAAAGHTFTGFPWPTKLAAPLLLALPFFLHVLDLASGQMCGILYAAAFLLVSLSLACWPALEAAETNGHRAVLVAIALAAGAAGGVPLVRSLAPGEPAAKATFTKAGEKRALKDLAPGPYDLFVHAEFGVTSREVHAAYVVRLAKGGKGIDIEGQFDSARTRGRAGRRAVEGVKPPRSWNRHPIRVVEASPEAELVKAHESLAEGIDIYLYGDVPLWPFLAGAVLLALLAIGVCARLSARDARDLFAGGVIAALCTGVLGSTWAWLGEPLLPLIGASFAGVVGGWLAAKILGRAARSLPWAAR